MKASHPPSKRAEQQNLSGNFAAELGRQQMVQTIESACAMFRSFESMRSIQQQAAHQALSHYLQAAQRLHEPCGAGELMQVQNELLQWELEAAARYWQDLGAAAMGLQSGVYSGPRAP